MNYELPGLIVMNYTDVLLVMHYSVQCMCSTHASPTTDLQSCGWWSGLVAESPEAGAGWAHPDQPRQDNGLIPCTQSTSQMQ